MNAESLVQLAQDYVHDSRGVEVDDEMKDAHALRQAKAVVFLLHQGRGEAVWPLLKHSPDPRLRAFLIDQFPKLEVSIETIYVRLMIESEPSIRFALTLRLGGYRLQDFGGSLPTQVHDRLLKWYASDPDAGVHAATQWLFRYLSPETWYDAAAYCNWLSEQDGLAKDQWCYEPNVDGEYAAGMKAKEGFPALEGYRLPTEAEWEYACRSGTVTTRYYGSGDSLLSQYAWYSPISDDQCHEVGLLRPNDFGLFDMLGNEYEWCHGLYRSYRDLGGKSFPASVMDWGDTEPATDNQRRVIRGGSFDYSARHSRSAYRTIDTLDMRISNNGFRPARTISKRR